VEGLGVVAQRKGAEAVIATRWSVADSSTSLLMQDFCRRQESPPGILKSEALREAQVALLQGEVKPPTQAADQRGVNVPSQPAPTSDRKDFSHPYYWAPFFLMGNWL